MLVVAQANNRSFAPLHILLQQDAACSIYNACSLKLDGGNLRPVEISSDPGDIFALFRFDALPMIRRFPFYA